MHRRSARPDGARPAGHDGPIGGGEAASEAGCGDEAEGVGQADEVERSLVDHDVLGERAPVREAGLGLRVADLLVARGTRAQRPHAQMNGAVTRSPTGPAGRLGRADGRRSRPRTRGPARGAGRCRSRVPSSRASRCGRARWPRPSGRRRNDDHGCGTSFTTGRTPYSSITTARIQISLVRRRRTRCLRDRASRCGRVRRGRRTPRGPQKRRARPTVAALVRMRAPRRRRAHGAGDPDVDVDRFLEVLGSGTRRNPIAGSRSSGSMIQAPSGSSNPGSWMYRGPPPRTARGVVGRQHPHQWSISSPCWRH